jgi:hypothetical protein
MLIKVQSVVRGDYRHYPTHSGFMLAISFLILVTLLKGFTIFFALFHSLAMIIRKIIILTKLQNAFSCVRATDLCNIWAFRAAV